MLQSAAQNHLVGHEFKSHDLDYSELNMNQTRKQSKFSAFSKLKKVVQHILNYHCLYKSNSMEQSLDLLHNSCLNVIPINAPKIKENIVYYKNRTF
jgi:hypothetical protein